MRKIKLILGLFLMFLTNIAFVTMPVETHSPSRQTIAPPQLINKNASIKITSGAKWHQKIMYKIASKRFKKIQEDGPQKVKKRGNITLILAILTPILFIAGVIIEAELIALLSLLGGIAALFLGIFTFTDVYADRLDKLKALFGILIGLLSIAFLIWLSFVVLELI